MAYFPRRQTVANALILAILWPLASFAGTGGDVPKRFSPAPPLILVSEALPETAEGEVVSSSTPPAAADADIAPPAVGPPGQAPAPAASKTFAPDWRWRRAEKENYLGVALVGAGAAFVESKYGKPGANWTSRNDFDEFFRDLLRLGGRDDRKAAHTIGDVLMWGMIAAPVLDGAVTLGIRDGAWDTLWQTEMVNLESYAFTSFVSALLQDTVGREKPFKRNCQNGVCEGDQENRSMPSGHVAFALTGAGLVCNHHEYQSLYRDPESDRAACLTGIGLAAVDGVVRIMADHHYATDVMVGAAIGYFSGFILPRLLHYSHPAAPPPERKAGTSLLQRVSLRPMLSGSATGLSCQLRF